jgi:hypothetical protein
MSISINRQIEANKSKLNPATPHNGGVNQSIVITAVAGTILSLVFFCMSMGVMGVPQDTLFAANGLLAISVIGTASLIGYQYLEGHKKKKDPALLTLCIGCFVLGTAGFLLSQYYFHSGFVGGVAAGAVALFGYVNTKRTLIMDYREAKDKFNNALKLLLKNTKAPPFEALEHIMETLQFYPELLHREIKIGPQKTLTPYYKALNQQNVVAAYCLLKLGANGEASELINEAINNNDPHAAWVLADNGAELSTQQSKDILRKTTSDQRWMKAFVTFDFKKNGLHQTFKMIHTKLLTLDQNSSPHFRAELNETLLTYPDLFKEKNGSDNTLLQEAVIQNKAETVGFLMEINGEELIDDAIAENDFVTLDYLIRHNIRLSLNQIHNILAKEYRLAKKPGLQQREVDNNTNVLKGLLSGLLKKAQQLFEDTQSSYWFDVLAHSKYHHQGEQDIFNELSHELSTLSGSTDAERLSRNHIVSMLSLYPHLLAKTDSTGKTLMQQVMQSGNRVGFYVLMRAKKMQGNEDEMRQLRTFPGHDT